MSTLIPFFVFFGWNKLQEQQKEDGKAKLKISGCIHQFKMLWESMKKPLYSCGKFPRIFDIENSSRDPGRLGGEEHATRKLRGPDHLHVNVQRHSVENR